MGDTEELLTRGVTNIVPNKEALKSTLSSGKKLNVYIGIDPTATHIHLGHTVPLRKLQQFADLEHHVTFLIGDFTALIGDTSDKETERPVLTSEEINANFQTYKKQAEKILDFSKIAIKHNSEWLKKLDFEEIIKLIQHFSAGDFYTRELIKKRLQEGKHVGLHEALYPVMQGYDSYYMNTDIQIGGADQIFNMQAGRTLQKVLRNKESFVLATDYLLGTDGRKMSKSWGNAIWLDDTAEDMYAKIMAINDDLIEQYYLLTTNIPLNNVWTIIEELKRSENPMPIKKRLAKTIVSELYDQKTAQKAQDAFEKKVQQKELPTEMQEITVAKQTYQLADLLVETNLAASKSEAKRLIEQGGLTLDGTLIENPNSFFAPENNQVIKVGKRKFVKIKTSVS